MNRNITLGLLAALAAALIGSGWQLVSRHGVTTKLGPLEIALLRYGLPALVLLPLLWRKGGLPMGLRGVQLAMFMLGGLPFGWMVLAGAQWAPAAHIGIFTSGSVPLFTALLAWRVHGEAMSRARGLGLLLVALGLVVLGAASLASAVSGVGSGAALATVSVWRGDALFLLAGLMWAVHTLAYRRSGLGAWHAAAVLNGGSALMLVPVVAWLGAPRLFTAPWPDVALQAVGQGVVAGLLGLVTFMAAVTRLGAARASLSAALVPLLTALGAAWLLHESVSPRTWVALGLVMLGLVLAGRASQTTVVNPKSG